MNRKNKKGRRVCYPAASTYTFFVLRVAPVEALAESLIREFHRKRWIAGMPITRGRAGMRGSVSGGCEAGEGVGVLQHSALRKPPIWKRVKRFNERGMKPLIH